MIIKLDSYWLKISLYYVLKHMDIFTQKCNKLVIKISSYYQKQNYKQIHIPVDISCDCVKYINLDHRYNLISVSLSWMFWGLCLEIKLIIFLYIMYVVHSISFQTFIVQAFKIVIDSWKFSMLLLYILWDDWPIFMIWGLNEQLQHN